MTDTFTASNGIEITMDPDREGKVYLVGRRARGDEGQYLDTHATAGPEGIVALREFFQHERDEALGRWRWPENPSFVAWASRRSNEKDVTVLDESSGYVGYFTRGDVADVRPGVGLIRGAARAYFEAHPERKPLPEIDGIYAVSPNVHPYERLIQRRNGEWIHLRRSASEFETDNISAQSIAQSAVDEGRLTRLVAEDAS